MIIREDQITVSETDPSKILYYAIYQINIDESKSLMTVFARNKAGYDIILENLKKLHSVAKASQDLQVPFKTSCHKSNYSFKISRNLYAALELFRVRTCCSEVTFKKATAFLNAQPEEKPRSTFSTMSLYN